VSSAVEVILNEDLSSVKVTGSIAGAVVTLLRTFTLNR